VRLVECINERRFQFFSKVPPVFDGNVDGSYGDLPIVAQINKITEGKEDENIKGKNMFICSIHTDNVLEVNKRNLELPQSRI